MNRERISMTGNEITYKINIIGTPKLITKLIQQSTTVSPSFSENEQRSYEKVTQVIKQSEYIFTLQFTFWSTLTENWRESRKGKLEFYRHTDGAILVFDFGNAESFTDLKAWSDELKQYTNPQTPIVLLGIKSEHAEISTQMVREFAEKLHLKQFKTSISNTKVLRRLGRIIIEQILQHGLSAMLKICIIGNNTNNNLKFGNLTADTKWDTKYLHTTGHVIPTKKVIIDKTVVKLIMVVLAGEEFLGKLRPSSYRGASGCLILFDKGNAESFSSVPRWYDEFKNNVNDISIPVALVGIGADKDEITIENGQDLADQLKIGYYETRINDKYQITHILREMTETLLNRVDKSREKERKNSISTVSQFGE